MGKKFVYNFFVFTSIVAVFIFLIVIILDPYYETNLIKIDGINNYKFEQTQLSTKVLLEKLNSDKYSLVFGTSRSRKIDSELLNDNVLNIYPIYGHPISVYNFLNTLSKKQIENINKIYYLIDFQCFSDNNSVYENRFVMDLNSNYEFILNYLKLFSIDKLFASVTMVLNNVFLNFNSYVSENGFAMYKEKDITNFDNNLKDIARQSKNSIKNGQEFSIQMLNYLSKIDEFSKKNNIEVTYFTSTFMQEYLNKMDYNLTVSLRNEFLTNISGFYDLAFIPDVSNKPEFFTNPTHISKDATKYIVDILLNKNNEFFVTKENFETKMEIYKKICNTKE